MERFALLLDTPVDDAVAQRQAGAALPLFPRHARPGPRLCAGGAHRRPAAPPAAAPPADRDHGRPHRPGALRPVARLRRRHGRNRRPHVARQPRARNRPAAGFQSSPPSKPRRRERLGELCSRDARPPRRPRPLGPVEAAWRRPARRRLGPPRQAGARRHERASASAISRKSGTPSRKPYLDLFAWLEGREPKPTLEHKPVFRPSCSPIPSRKATGPVSPQKTFPPNGNGTASACRSRPPAARRGSSRAPATRSRRPFRRSRPLSPRSQARPCSTASFSSLRDGTVAPFNDLQQRLNRKVVTPRMMRDYPAHVRLYDLLDRRRRGPARASLRRAPRPPRSLARSASTRR